MMTQIYKPLPDTQWIRLLALYPGRGQDAILINLQTVSLASNPAYEALSYVWGKEPPNESIIVQSQAFPARPNLVAALRRLRLPDKQRIIWIDAICINQFDLDERAAQVNHMRAIYTRATRVLVFMPEQHAHSAAAAWELASRIVHVRALYFGRFDVSSAPIALRVQAKNELEASLGWNGLMEATRSWLGNEWFRRVWTFQEAYLASEALVLCGEQELHFQGFVVVWSEMFRIGVRPDLTGIECARVLMATCSWAMAEEPGKRREPGWEQRTRLSTLLRSLEGHKVTDDRDRLYGMLAMVQLADDLRFVPNYRTSVEDTYTRLAKFLIEDDGHLQILSDAQGLVHDAKLPSWVPDWRGRAVVHRLAERTRDFERTFRVNSSFEPSQVLLPCDEEKKIRLRGVMLGKVINARCGPADLVRDIHRSHVRKNNWRDHVAAPSKMCHLFRSLGALPVPEIYPPTGEPAIEACVRTLAADELPCSERMRRYVHEYYPAYADYSNMSWREAVAPLRLPDSTSSGASGHVDPDMPGGPAFEITNMLFARSLSGPPRLDPRESIPARLRIEEIAWAVAKDVCRAIETHAYRRVLVVTNRGYLGLAPEEAETGDEVWTLAGGDVPFVLRRQSAHLAEDSGASQGGGASSPSPGKEPKLVLIGDCYVHGVMDGELWQDHEALQNETSDREPLPRDDSMAWTTIMLV